MKQDGNIKKGTLSIIVYLDKYPKSTLTSVHENSGLGNVHTVYDRLGELQRAGLVLKEQGTRRRNASAYSLTDEGHRAAMLINELGKISPSIFEIRFGGAVQ